MLGLTAWIACSALATVAVWQNPKHTEALVRLDLFCTSSYLNTIRYESLTWTEKLTFWSVLGGLVVL